MDAIVGSTQPPGELGVEVGDVRESATGQEARLQIAVRPLDEPFGFRVHSFTATPKQPRNAWNSSVRRCWPRRHWPMQLSWSHTHSPGTAPNWARTCNIPAVTSAAVRVGIIHAPVTLENPDTPVTTHNFSD